MSIDEGLAQELNKQLNVELEAAYLYLSMSGYLSSCSLDGMAHWMLLQSKEEVEHAMKFFNYLLDRDYTPRMLPITQPKVEFTSVLEVYQTALENEQKLAGVLNDLAETALQKKDNTTYQFLEWFLTEQVEEIATCNTIVDKLKLIGDNGYGLLMLSGELGQRTATDG